MDLPFRLSARDCLLSIASWIASSAAVLLLLSIATCTVEVAPLSCRPAGSCPNGWLVYNDTLCGPPDINNGPSCHSVGDGLCYKRCDTDADCRAVGLRVCGSLTLYQGGDAGHQVGVCSGTTDLDACAADSGTDGAGAQ